MNIKNSFRLIVAVAALGLLCLTGFWLRSEYTRLLSEKRQQIDHYVDLAYSVLVHFRQLEETHQLSGEDARRAAVRTVRDMRYDGRNYFWINDLDKKMILHPAQPSLEGTIRSDSIMINMLRVTKQSGSGFIEYKFAKPGRPANELSRKLSFVKTFAPWGWVVGTGIYIDDVDAAWRQNAIHAMAITLVCVAVLLFLSTATFRSLFRQLGQIVEQMSKVALCRGSFGNLGSLHLPEPANDDRRETAVLVRGLNEMLRQIEQRDQEIASHQKHLERCVAERTAELRSVNSGLEAAHRDAELVLESIPSLLIRLDREGRITRWNAAAAKTFGLASDAVAGRTLANCGIRWLHADTEAELAQWLHVGEFRKYNDIAYERDGSVRFLGLSVRPVLTVQGAIAAFLVTGTDITEWKCLEEQLRQAHKLEAIGQLAAGVAHEINTPTQYVTNNTQFLKSSWNSIQNLLDLCRAINEEAATQGSVSVASLARFDQASAECELDYLQAEIPHVLDESLEGLARVAKIVRSMKEFAHPGGSEKQLTNINAAIESTIALSRGEWKPVTEVTTDLDAHLPPVPCFVCEFNQVILNLIVNSAQAISKSPQGAGEKREIRIATRHSGNCVTISVHDTGPGIPEAIQPRVFEPFFTTKPVGEGTGQGLAIAHAVIVKKHHGRIWFETEPGHGTTFFVQLPLAASTSDELACVLDHSV